MSLLDYIKGNRKGKDAHRLEKESMSDPFLSEAIEGYDSIPDDHMSRIEDIQVRLKAVSGHKKSKRHAFAWVAAAASVIGVLLVGGYIFVEKPQSVEYTQKMYDILDMPEEVIDVYVPTAYYEDHEEMIEDKNVVLYEPDLHGVLNREEESPIRIYVPGEYYEENKETIQKAEEIFPRHNS